MKVGIEVEGVLRGKKTLFIQAAELVAFGFSSIEDIRFLGDWENEFRGVEHVYVSDHDNILGMDVCSLSYAFALNLKAKGIPVTLEKTIVGPERMDYPSNVGIMLAIQDSKSPAYCPNNSFWHLKDTDQVKFSRISPIALNDSEHNVYCIQKSGFSVTDPSEFKDDVTLTIKVSK